MDLPASGDFDVGTIDDNDVAAGLFEALRTCIEEAPGGLESEAIEIGAAGDIEPAGCAVTVDTESGDPTDEMSNAVYTNHGAGRWLLIRSTSSARVVTIEHLAGGNGEFFLLDAVDLVLDDPAEYVLFIREGTRWKEFLRSIPNRLDRVQVVTAIGASPLALVASDSGKVLQNTGAAAATFADLPAAAPGIRFFLYVAAAFTWNLNRDGADTFRDLAATGTTFSLAAVVGNYVEVECVVAGEWVVTRKQGVLTIT